MDDQIGSPTYTADFAPLICDMISTEKYGTYHATNESYCSWAEFTEEIFKLADYTTKVILIQMSECQTKAKWPKNSKLGGKDKTVAISGKLSHWKEALFHFIVILIFERYYWLHNRNHEYI